MNAPGVTYESARITALTQGCGYQVSGSSSTVTGNAVANQFSCVTMTAEILTGPDEGQSRDIQMSGESTQAGLDIGNTVYVMRNPATGQAIYSLSGIHRMGVTITLLALFIVAVLAVARWKGFWALIGLVFSIAVLIGFMLPALATGESGLLVGIVGSMAIMFVVIFVAHGFSLRTSAALMGTLIGLAFSTGLGMLAVRFGHLSGYVSEEELTLGARVNTLDFQQLLVAAMVVAGLGVLNDVTITQSSAVWELRAAGRELTRRQVFASAMRIGRDHIASTIYTIVFAYAGAALSTLMLLILFYDQPIWQLLSTQQMGTEVLRTLASATGLVLAVPITTGISAAMITGATSRCRTHEGVDTSGSASDEPGTRGAVSADSTTGDDPWGWAHSNTDDTGYRLH